MKSVVHISVLILFLARSGATSEKLLFPLTQQWIYESPIPPKPTWVGPQKVSGNPPKLHFDEAFYTVSVGEMVVTTCVHGARRCMHDEGLSHCRWRMDPCCGTLRPAREHDP